MKKLVIGILVSLGLWCAASQMVYAEEKPPSLWDGDVAVIVNGEMMTKFQLMHEMAPYMEQIRQRATSREDYKRRIKECQLAIVNQFIDMVLVVQDFEARGGVIPEGFEAKEYDLFVHDNFKDDRIEFAKYLQDRGTSVKDFKKSIRRRAIVSFVMGNIYDGRQEVGPKKIEAYYNEHIAEFSSPEQFYILEFKLLPGNAEDILIQARSLLNTGEMLPGAIKKNFKDSIRVSDFGYVNPDDLLPLYRETLEHLELKKASPIVQNGQEYFVLFIADKRPAKVAPLKEVADEIEQRLNWQYQEAAKQKYLDKLREKAYIRLFI